MTSQTIDVVKAVAVAPAAITSPLWLSWLHTVSEPAALIFPILGVIFLVMQMTHFIMKNRK